MNQPSSSSSCPAKSLGVLLVPAQRPAYAVREADRAAEPHVDPAGEERLQHPELLGDDQRLVVRQHHPARADPDRAVAAATAAASTVGAEPATPGTPWCSETQNRW